MAPTSPKRVKKNEGSGLKPASPFSEQRQFWRHFTKLKLCPLAGLIGSAAKPKVNFSISSTADMTEDEKPDQKPAPASLAERLKSIQDQADKIGPVDPELDHKAISDWICEDAPSGQSDAT